MSYRAPRFPTVGKIKIAAAVITLIVIIVILAESIVIVEAGHRGVVLYLGAVENRVLAEGVHFIAHYLEHVVPMEVRTNQFPAEASAASNDLQEVQTVIALNYRIDPQEAKKTYQVVGPNYADRVIAPTIQESVKASVAKFNAEELITKRQTAKSVIANAIRSTPSANDIQAQNVFITDFKFSQAFSTQIEQKVSSYPKIMLYG